MKVTETEQKLVTIVANSLEVLLKNKRILKAIYKTNKTLKISPINSFDGDENRYIKIIFSDEWFKDIKKE